MRIRTMTQKCKWVLEAFDKQTDWLVNEWTLIDIDVTTLQTMFNEPPDEPMIYGYDVTAEHVAVLRRYTDAEIDLQKYNYQVGCFAV
jgi:hypothetical protein